jgi:hypothetical protein
MKFNAIFMLFFFTLPWKENILKAQQQVIRLNRHYYEIAPDDSVHHTFNKLISYTPDSTQIQRIFSLNNKINRIIRTAKPKEEFQEQITEHYDPMGNIQWKKTLNLVNGKFLTTYFFDQQQVGQVLYEGGNNYLIIRSGEEEPMMTYENDFEPFLINSKEEWRNYLSNHLGIKPSEMPANNQKIIVALYVTESGEVSEVEWANPLDAEKKYADRFLELVKNWDWKFLPAKNAFGIPEGKWITIPFNLGQ